MSKKPENPAAFPVNATNEPNPGAYAAEPGVSLRDYFAGQALVGIMSSIPPTMRYEPWQVALDAYTTADAMLAERAKTEGK